MPRGTMRRRLIPALLTGLVLVGLLPFSPVSVPVARATHGASCPMPADPDNHVVHVGGGDLVRVDHQGDHHDDGADALVEQVEEAAGAQGCEPLDVESMSPDKPFMFMRYYPERLQVHRGDTVEFRFSPGYSGWHSVTFSPVDLDVTAHPEPSDDAHPHLLRKDETDGSAAFDEEWVFGSPRDHDNRIACGMRAPQGGYGRPAYDGKPCVVDESKMSTEAEVVSSAMSETFFGMIEPSPFVVQVDLPPGTYRYHCKEHPTMHGVIEVLPDSEALPTPTEVDAAARTELAEDIATAEALWQAHQEPTSVPLGDGRQKWFVHAGATSDDGAVSIHAYLPGNLEVPEGDTVEFVHGSVGDPHTVSFPEKAGGAFGVDGACLMYECTLSRFVPYGLGGLGFPWFNCELDGPDTGLVSQPLWVPGRGCAQGSSEWPMVPWTIHAQPTPGNEVLTPGTYHSSAMLATHTMPDGSPTPEWTYMVDNDDWGLEERFTARFPQASEQPFTYICYVHPDLMKGSIRVVEPAT